MIIENRAEKLINSARQTLNDIKGELYEKHLDNIRVECGISELWLIGDGLDGGCKEIIPKTDDIDDDLRRFSIHDLLMSTIQRDDLEEYDIDKIKDGVKMLRSVADEWEQKAIDLIAEYI